MPVFYMGIGDKLSVLIDFLEFSKKNIVFKTSIMEYLLMQ